MKKMKHKTYLSYIVLTVLMTGCLKVENKNQKNNQPEVQQLVQSLPVNSNYDLVFSDISIVKIGQHRPNVYNVLISWPKTRNGVRVIKQNKVECMVSSGIESCTLLDLAGGDHVTFIIEILNEDNSVVETKLYEEEIPEDLNLSGEIELSRNMEYVSDRIFMDNALITTKDFNVLIKAKELFILSNSRIQNFADNSKANPGNHGRNGGTVTVEAKYAEGALSINLNAEAGGDGLQGYYITRLSGGKEKQDYLVGKCRDGGNGYDAGVNGNLKVNIDRSMNFYSDVIPQSLALGGRVGPKLGQAPSLYPSMKEGTDCPSQPIAGNSGSKGRVCKILDGQVIESECD